MWVALACWGMMALGQSPMESSAPPPEPMVAAPLPPLEPQVPTAAKPPAPIPWKTITKAGSAAAYAVWMALWLVTVPVGFTGALLAGLGSSQDNVGMVAGGLVVVCVGALLMALGVAAAATGAGLGVGTTVLQLLDPDEKATDATVTMFLPRTLLL